MATKKASKKAGQKAGRSSEAPKARADVKSAAGKAAEKKASTAPSASKKTDSAPAPPMPPNNGSISERQQAEIYAQAVEAFQAGKYKRALGQFETVADGPDAGLRHRAHVHIRICRQRTESDTVELRTAEDYYNYAVKLINDRRLEDADRHLDQALKKAAGAGHIHYAKALVAALRRNGDEAYRSLSRAIELDPKHRLLARRDPDMAGVRDHERIATLLQGDDPGAA